MARPKTVTDEKLLAVARRLFLKHGHGVSTKQIAAAAKVSEGVLFQRFTNKSELFFAAMVPPPAGSLNELLGAGGKLDHAALEQLIFALTDYFRQFLPVIVTLMAHPDFRFEDFVRRNPDSPLALLRMQLTRYLSAQKAQGAIGDVHAGAAALNVWATAQTVAFFELLGAHDGRMDPEVLRAAVDALWRGLRPAPLR